MGFGANRKAKKEAMKALDENKVLQLAQNIKLHRDVESNLKNEIRELHEQLQIAIKEKKDLENIIAKIRGLI